MGQHRWTLAALLHEATLTQAGRNNTYGIFQFGKATNADVVQTGRGDVGLVFQGGW